jgi:hypothetical protein
VKRHVKKKMNIDNSTDECGESTSALVKHTTKRSVHESVGIVNEFDTTWFVFYYLSCVPSVNHAANLSNRFPSSSSSSNPDISEFLNLSFPV